MDENEEKKDIEVIQGDGKDLDISPVYNHIILDEPKKNKGQDKKIVIPEKKKNK